MSFKVKYIFLLCIGLSCSSQFEMKAQAPLQILLSKNPPTSPHTAYVELIGLAIYPATLNYDLVMMRYKGWGLSGRLGYGYAPVLKDRNDFSEHILVGGLQVHQQWGRHGIEVGWGSVYRWTRLLEEPDTAYRFQTLYYGLSYRLQNPAGGFFLKVSLYALDYIYFDGSFRFQPIEGSAGVSLGYTFKSRKR